MKIVSKQRCLRNPPGFPPKMGILCCWLNLPLGRLFCRRSDPAQNIISSDFWVRIRIFSIIIEFASALYGTIYTYMHHIYVSQGQKWDRTLSWDTFKSLTFWGSRSRQGWGTPWWFSFFFSHCPRCNGEVSQTWSKKISDDDLQQCYFKEKGQK